jgi:hypothetical protein
MKSAHHEGDGVHALLAGLEPRVREDVAVDAGMERHGADGREQLAGGLGLGGEHDLGGEGAHGVDVVGVDSSAAGEDLGDLAGLRGVEQEVGGAALGDRPVEEPGGERHRQQ